jgi:hypothetical protein
MTDGFWKWSRPILNGMKDMILKGQKAMAPPDIVKEYVSMEHQSNIESYLYNDGCPMRVLDL